jgi:hypothetical protein
MTRVDAENHNEPKHRNLKLVTPRNPSTVAMELVIVSLLFDYVAMGQRLSFCFRFGFQPVPKKRLAEEAREWRPWEGLFIGLLKAGVACADRGRLVKDGIVFPA